MNGASGFIQRLAAELSRDPLREKVLLAPSHRVGRQWLDQAAAVAGGVANVRTATLNRLILDCADAGLRRKGLRTPTREEKVRLVGLALGEIAADGDEDGYFSRLPVTVALAEAMLSTLEELETAAVRGTMALTSGVAVPEKARELARLVRVFGDMRKRENLAARDDIHRAALATLAKKGRAASFPLLLLPASTTDDLSSLEWGFLSRWPEAARKRLDEDEEPAGASLEFFSADSVANEAREVLRRIRALGIPLDRAEVVCLDAATYSSALCAAGLECFGGRPEDLPMTFHGGLPGCFSRPARLLAAWLEWLELDVPPEGLARMLDAGLLGENWQATVPGVSAAMLAGRLRCLPIDGGPAEYRRHLGRENKGERLARAESWLDGWLWDILPLSDDGGELRLDAPGAVLDAADRLLRATAGGDGKLDAYARLALTEAIAGWRPHCDWPGFEPLAWLNELVSGLHVMGLGPMPGRLHVADLTGGGQAGRGHVFIMGMDDGRYPGGARQDPVLLDRERSVISNGLAKSGRRRERRERAFRRLLGRLRGGATLSYARTESGEGRQQYPATVFSQLAAKAARQVEAVSLRPRKNAAGLNRRDDWLETLLATSRNRLTARDVRPWFPGLADGGLAAAARLSSGFTVYDGNVPEAGADWRREERTLSPTDMEILAACPLEFFFKRILEMKPPDRYEPRPGRWLPGNTRGSLLHDLFQDFLNELARLDQAVEEERLEEQGALLRRMLDEAIARERRRTPARDVLAGRREEREMSEACGIFLDSEILRHRKGRPLCLEAALGGAKEEVPPWNRSDPVELRLDSGELLRLKGRVDRIDRLRDHGGLIILDYKTGMSGKFSPDDPFRQGRHLQPLLYTRMLERVLEEAGMVEPVRGFGYFFPMPRDEGRTIFYSRDMLGWKGMAIVEALAALLSAGRFPFTTEAKDVEYSDYAPLYGDVRQLAAAAAAKAENDPLLADWARLRGLSGNGEDDDAE